MPTLRRVTAQLLRIRRKQLGLTQTEAAVQVAATAEALGYPPRRVEQTTWRYWENPAPKNADRLSSGIDSSWWLPISVWMRLGSPLNFAILLMTWPIEMNLSSETENALDLLEEEAGALENNARKIARDLPGRTSMPEVREHFKALEAKSVWHREELGRVAQQIFEEIEILVGEITERQDEQGLPTLDLHQLAAGEVRVSSDQSLLRLHTEQEHLSRAIASLQRTLVDVIPMAEQLLGSQAEQLAGVRQDQSLTKPDD